PWLPRVPLVVLVPLVPMLVSVSICKPPGLVGTAGRIASSRPHRIAGGSVRPSRPPPGIDQTRVVAAPGDEVDVWPGSSSSARRAHARGAAAGGPAGNRGGYGRRARRTRRGGAGGQTIRR